MAKSLRSKSKLRAKSVKRGKEFQKAVDERQLRLLEKAKEHLIVQKTAEAKAKNNAEGDDIQIEEEENKEEQKETKKVSTSGYRTARHHLWKKSNKKNHNSFSKKK